jgi:hypothetical protein
MAAPSIPLTGVRKIAVKVRRRMAESPSVLFQPCGEKADLISHRLCARAEIL